MIDWLIDDDIWTRISMIDWLTNWWWYNYSTVRCPMADWLIDWLIHDDIWTYISMIDWLRWWYNYNIVRCMNAYIPMTEWLTDWLMLIYQRIFQWLIDYDEHDIVIVESDVL